MRSRLACAFLLGASLMPGSAVGQDAETLRKELDQMKRQFDQLKKEYEKSIDQMSERLKRLEAQPQPTVAPPAPPVTTQVPSPPSPAGPSMPSAADLLRPREPYALYGAGGRGQLLFDVGVVGDFIADFSTQSSNAYQPLATFPGQAQRFFPREVELGFYGAVDPYARAYVIVEAGEEFDPTNRTSTFGVELAEAAVTLTALPWGFQDKLGLMRVRYGLLNQLHDHDLPQPDRPAVLVNFFGQEGLTESGNELSWVPNLPFYLEGIFGIFNGDNDVAFGSASFRNPLFTGRLRTFLDFGSFGALQIGGSVAAGTTNQGQSDTILDFEAKYKFSPEGWRHPLLTVAGEWLQAWRNNLVTSTSIDPDTGEEIATTSTQKTTPFGFYVYAEVQPFKRWLAGVRYDNSEFLQFAGRQWAVEPYIAFQPSDFLRFRLAYKHTYFNAPAVANLGGPSNGSQSINEILFQATFLLGAHPAHPF
jgi:hypothetical protein